MLSEVTVGLREAEEVDGIVPQGWGYKSHFLGIWNAFWEENRSAEEQMNSLQVERIGLSIISILIGNRKRGLLLPNFGRYDSSSSLSLDVFRAIL